jgi:hypothetical protein
MWGGGEGELKIGWRLKCMWLSVLPFSVLVLMFRWLLEQIAVKRKESCSSVVASAKRELAVCTLFSSSVVKDV